MLFEARGASTIDGVQQFGKGFAVGLLHGGINRYVHRATIRIEGRDYPTICGETSRLVSDATICTLAVYADYHLNDKKVTTQQLAGHALGQMIGEGFYFDECDRPRVAFSINMAGVLAVVSFIGDKASALADQRAQ